MEKSSAKNTASSESTSKAVELPQAVGSESHSLLRLQSAVGNQAVQRLLRDRIARAKLTTSHPSDAYQPKAGIAEPIASSAEPQLLRACECGGSCTTCKAKGGLKVSQHGDAAEIEAGRLADTLMRLPVTEEKQVTKSGNGLDMLYRKVGAGEEQEEKIQRKELSGQNIPSQSPTHVKNATSAGGHPLDAQTRKFFEPRLGYDLGSVRVHTDASAGQSARAVDAKAYTLGNNIVFGNGQYSPGSEAGRKLIAHELAHVTQLGSSSNIRRDTIYRQPDDDRELAVTEYQILQLRQLPILPPPMIAQLAELERRRVVLLAHGAGAPVGETVVCSDKDRAFNISKQQNKCLNLSQRWKLYKAHVDTIANLESDRGARIKGVTDWSDFLSQDEFNQLDSKRTYRDMIDEYEKYYAGGGQSERYERERQAKQEAEKPSPPKEKPSDEPFSFLAGMNKDDLDRITRGFGVAPPQSEEPAPAPKAVETGCHTDPYAGHKASTVCGQKRPDEATQTSMKLMQSQELDDAIKEANARRDRLHALHVQAKKTEAFPATNEFSQYEIAADKEMGVSERWKISAEEHGVGENDLEADHYNTLLFRSRYEYNVEYRRKEKEYDEKFACESDRGLKWPKTSRTHPDWIDCQNRVEAEYYPGGHARKEAARWRAYVDIQAAMPVLTEAGPVAAFGFHIAHEWLGWSTERSAAFGNALGTTASLVGLRTQQVYSNRNAGQSVAPPDEMTPPPEHVAPAPTRDPIPAPGKQTVGQVKPPAPPPPVAQVKTQPPSTIVKTEPPSTVVKTEPPATALKTEPPPVVVKSEPPPVPVKKVKTEPSPSPTQTEPPPAPAKTPKPPKQRQTAKTATEPASTQTEPPPAPAKTPKPPKQKQAAKTATESAPTQTEPPPPPAKTPKPPKQKQKTATQPAPAASKTEATVSEGQTEPTAVPLRKQLRQNLEAEVTRIEKDIADLEAAKGRVQRQLKKIMDQLGTASGDEKVRLITLREKLKEYQAKSLGSGADLGKKWLEAKELLSLNEKDYFKALTDAAAKRPEYQSVKERKVDEVFQTTDTKLEVEHIYPRSKIWNLPGFVEKLSWKQQIAVFNYAKNLKLMSKKANIDRSNTPYKSLPRSVWSKYTSDESVVTNWSKLEDEVQRDIEKMINDPSLIPITD